MRMSSVRFQLYSMKKANNILASEDQKYGVRRNLALRHLNTLALWHVVWGLALSLLLSATPAAATTFVEAVGLCTTNNGVTFETLYDVVGSTGAAGTGEGCLSDTGTPQASASSFGSLSGVAGAFAASSGADVFASASGLDELSFPDGPFFTPIQITFVATAGGTITGSATADIIGGVAGCLGADTASAAHTTLMIEITCTTEVFKPDAQVGVGLGIEARAPSIGDVADYGATAHFGISVPPGITVVSASGLFPATVGAISPVPEPASLLLIGTGLVGLTTRIRRRRKV